MKKKRVLGIVLVLAFLGAIGTAWSVNDDETEISKSLTKIEELENKFEICIKKQNLLSAMKISKDIISLDKKCRTFEGMTDKEINELARLKRRFLKINNSMFD